MAILTLGPCSRQIFRDPISRWPLELRPQHIYIIVTSWWPSLLRKKEFLKNLKFFPFPHWNWPAPHPHPPTPSDLWPSSIDLTNHALQEYIVVKWSSGQRTIRVLTQNQLRKIMRSRADHQVPEADGQATSDHAASTWHRPLSWSPEFGRDRPTGSWPDRESMYFI